MHYLSFVFWVSSYFIGATLPLPDNIVAIVEDPKFES